MRSTLPLLVATALAASACVNRAISTNQDAAFATASRWRAEDVLRAGIACAEGALPSGFVVQTGAARQAEEFRPEQRRMLLLASNRPTLPETGARFAELYLRVGEVAGGDSLRVIVLGMRSGRYVGANGAYEEDRAARPIARQAAAAVQEACHQLPPPDTTAA